MTSQLVPNGAGFGWVCIENTCLMGLAVLGDFHAAARCAARRGQYVHSGLHP